MDRRLKRRELFAWALWHGIELVWFLLEGGMGLAQRNARKSRRIRPSVNDGTN